VICITAGDGWRVRHFLRSTPLPFRPERRVLGGVFIAARVAGLILIAIGILNLPAIRLVLAHYDALIDLVVSLILMGVGALWLVLLSWMIRFFDDFLSRH